MTIIVTGARAWIDWATIYRALSKYPPGTILVNGDCRDAPFHSADRICQHIGRALGHDVRNISAEWRKYGNSAGPIRNALMLTDYPEAREVLAFPLPKGRGTQDMMRKATAAGRDVILPREVRR